MDRAIDSLNQEVDFSTLEGGPWDGKRYSYIPRAPGRMPRSVPIFSEAKPADPVTYQVIRWKLWGINLEHADTLKRLSGTRVIVYADDFATSILTGFGENVLMSPTIQYFGGMSDLVVNWTLENRSENPGIEDGDVFLQNDPYIGTAHQPDTALCGPVFWNGKIFCWVYNSCHMGDIGGIAPGSFCVEAKDMYDEPTPIPPIKIGRKNILQSDVADMFARQSRAPEMVALQLRSQMAGFSATRDRMLEMIDQYGPEIVAGVMNRIIEDCAEAVKRRLESIPDGEWCERFYVGGVMPRDRKVHPVVTTITKSGGRLTCANAGTAPQLASGNGTYASWRSALLCAVSNILAYDQMGCPAGILRQLRFAPTPGLLNCSLHPGAVTTVVGTLISVACSGQVISNMVLSGPASLRANARAAGGGTSHGLWSLSWLDANGQRQSDMIGAGIVSGLGASGERDGFDQGGMWIAPTNVAGDVEEWEETMPMIFLYRSDGIDSGGPGRFRGGNGTNIGIVAHKGESVRVQTYGSDAAINLEPGLSGGAPGRAGDFGFVPASPLESLMARSDFPGTLDEVRAKLGEPTRLDPRISTPMARNDVFVVGQSGSGGFGDPILRSPERVSEDVRSECVSKDLAQRVYGVVINADGRADSAATDARRAQIRRDRLAQSQPELHAHSHSKINASSPRWRVGDSLIAAGSEDAWDWVCAHCDCRIAPVTENYKDGCRVISVSPELMDAVRFPSPKQFSDAPMVARQYLCASCGTLLGSEFCLNEDKPFHDVRIDMQWLREHADRTASPVSKMETRR